MVRTKTRSEAQRAVIVLSSNSLHHLSQVQKVHWRKEMKDWSEEDCRRVGCSLATFIRKRKTGEAAIDAWRLHYAPLNILFDSVPGFDEFMLTIANNTLRDSIYGMIYRVSVGAALST